jgi:uncharacterized protein with HEPN domain
MYRDKAILLDLVRAIQLILEFKHGMDKTAFLKDVKTQSAILHQLMILGEAVKRFSQEFRVQHPDIPWSLIAGMRDKLIHQYDDVDLDEVWKTIETDIPVLLSFLKPLLPREEN